MFVDVVPNRNSRPAILLRETWREAGHIKKRTLANLSDWPQAQVQALRAVLKGELTLLAGPASFTIERTRPHGHVAATLGTLYRLKLETVIAAKDSPERAAVLAMIVARILKPRSKLATARALSAATLSSSLGELLDLSDCDEERLYRAMDWLLPRQAQIEKTLARRHLSGATLALYDVTSTYFEGRACPLARHGYSRDHRRDKLQINLGLLTNAEGCPVAVEVFEGNTADPDTLGPVLIKLRERFALERIVLVGDRGLITSARIRGELQGQSGLDWITALRAPQIQQLRAGGTLQLSLFDEKDLAEISDPAYPGERLIACRNPLLAQERARKRSELLAATESRLQAIVSATQRAQKPLRGKDRIALRVGRVVARYHMRKHLQLEITETSFSFKRDESSIANEAALDGIYVIRTNLAPASLAADEAVRSYKRLAQVEQAFRALKSVDLKLRPIHHHLEQRVRAHVLLCMLAYYVEWHMRKALAPLLFDDDDPAAAEAQRSSVVAPAQRSPRARNKAATKLTEQEFPVHSFDSLLSDLATVAKNRLRSNTQDPVSLDVITTPTPNQQRAFDLLSVNYRM
ncbi:MAG: IS1634 family transposase [Deltaproteobacteria bacterium]|nr:IS1634 family transposase [Deltaproteobacteria bacterium]